MDSALQDFKNNPSSYYCNVELVQKTIEQIKKDFESIGCAIEIENEHTIHTYDEIMNALVPVITEMTGRNFEKLLYLLYRIDLSEQKVKELLNDTSVDFNYQLSHQILEREFKKVLIRKYYSGNRGEENAIL